MDERRQLLHRGQVLPRLRGDAGLVHAPDLHPVVVGAPVAFWGTRFAASAIEDLSAGGVPPVATAVVAMFVVGAVATFMPARRATRVEPVIALRSE